MPRPVKRALILGFGWFFIVLGVLGIFLPILQGILFLAIGLILLSRESEWAQRQIDRLKEKYPTFGEKYDEAEARAERLWDRIVNRNGTRAANDDGERRADDA